MKSRIQPIMLGVGILVAACTHSESSDDRAKAPESAGGSCRVLAIPPRAGGYNLFKTTIVINEQELREFVGDLKQDKFGNRTGNLVSVLEAAEIDFESELLVLLRHTERSGSNRVSLATPEKRESQLECHIIRKVPEVGTADMAYYCFALVVPKGIETLLVKTDGSKARLVALQ